MKYYYIQVEVPGSIDSQQPIDYSSPFVNFDDSAKLIFEGWEGGLLLETTPFYFVEENIARLIEEENLTGITFSPIQTDKDSQLAYFAPNLVIPSFMHMQIGNRPGDEDFGYSEKNQIGLVVSEQALKIIQPTLNNLSEVEIYTT